MGITGLIPFLKPASRPVNIKEYAGCTAAVDSYCWLHRGAIACAEKLARGDTTDVYVHYCIKYVEMLLSHQVKPIMVFDGRHLPAKADTEKSRRERRENNKKRAADLLRQDRPDEARNVMKGCIDITPEMAFALIKRCRAMGVDCIVAPFEADAQLAYLNLSGIAHIIITEDSDLLLFGCERVLFKMDLVGNGLLIEQTKLPLAMKVHPDKFSMDKFRHMCILSGCDYLASLPGIGLGKACKFIKRTAETNITRALTKLGAHLNMSSLVVSPDYREKFLIADSMFKHQPVFDPISRKVVPLTPLPEGVSGPDLEVFSPETSYQMALGNLNPFTLERFDSWDPDSDTVETSLLQQNYRTNGWNKGGRSSNSIWSKSFVRPKPIQPLDRRKVDHTTTQGKVVVHAVLEFEEKFNPSIPAKKKPEEEIVELREMFKISSPPCKKSKTEDLSSTLASVVVESSDPEDNGDMGTTSVEEDILKNLGFDDDDDDVAQVDDLMPKSPVLVGNKFIAHSRNKFACSKRLNHSNSSTDSRGLAGMETKQFTSETDVNVVCSRFFSSQDSNCENRPILSSEGPKIGRMDDSEFNSELDRIIHIDGGNSRAPELTPDRISPLCDTDSGTRGSNKVKILSPLSVVSELDKNLKFAEDRPSFLSRLDKMSQILSDKSPQKPPTNSSASFNWQKKKAKPQQKPFTSYLAPGCTPSHPPSKSKGAKSASKPSGLPKNKKPINQGNLLDNFGFKPKPKMTL